MIAKYREVFELMYTAVSYHTNIATEQAVI